MPYILPLFQARISAALPWGLRPEFEAVLFDFDGVLMDTEPVHFACWNEALAPLGVSLDWETYAANCIGASEWDTVGIFSRLAAERADTAALWERYPVKRDLFRRRMSDAPPFLSGMREFLAELHPRYRLAVVTSSARAEIEPLLERGGMRPFLGALVCGEDVREHKPAPEPYLLAARLLAVERALVVEDSNAGMESARRAGFEAVRIPAASETIELVRARLAPS
jgi:beta-phosphoglucomutase